MIAMAFLFPWVLAAAGAAAAPVVIHLVLRNRPKRIVLPTMRFVKKTHRESVSMLKLRHLLLLAMRMAAIILLAALIARARVSAPAGLTGRRDPVAAVFVVDNSGSMSLRRQGRTRLDDARRLASELLDALPDGSRSAVVASSGPPLRGGFLADRRLAGERIAAVRQTPGADPLAVAISRAGELCRDADLPRRELYVLTDMTQPAWRDGAGRIPTDAGIAAVVMDCSAGGESNVRTGLPELSPPTVPAGGRVTLEVVIESGGAGGDVPASVTLDGRPVAERTLALAAGEATTLRVPLMPTREGVLHGRASLGAADPLEMDDVRYFTLQARPPSKVLLVSDPGARRGRDTVAFLMRAALSPVGDDAPRFDVREVPSDRMTAETIGAAQVVLLCDVSGLDAPQWGELGAFAAAGRAVWIVPGELAARESYDSEPARRVMPASLGELTRLDEPASWTPADATAPMLSPFVGEENPPLSRVRCERRFEAGALAAGARTVIACDDGSPAVLVRRVGEGRSVLWTTSPTRAFSNLARTAVFPILVQRTARLLTARPGAETLFLWGRTVTIPLPEDLPAPVAMVTRPGARSPEPLTPPLGASAVSVLADRLGAWDVEFTSGERTVRRGFSVNADPSESDLSRVDARRVEELFGDVPVTIARTPDELAGDVSAARRPLDLTAPLLIALLALLAGEAWFANRFFRRRQGVKSEIRNANSETSSGNLASSRR